MVSRPWNDYSFAEYVSLEKHQPEDGVRHEFFDGEILAMTGGSPRHSALKTELLAQWKAQARPPCRVFDSDLWLGSTTTRMTTYADASVICGPLERHPDEPNIVTKPAVVAEVTSPSSERKDRGAKLAHYRAMPSVAAVVIVSHRERRVDVHRRGDGGSWTVASAAEGAIPVDDGITVDVDRLYQAADGL